jgi:hypothetical protein
MYIMDEVKSSVLNGTKKASKKDKRYRTTTPLELRAFSFLDNVRESGMTNMMFGSKLLQENFGLEKKEARFVHILWMKNHNREGDYKVVRVDGI